MAITNTAFITTTTTDSLPGNNQSSAALPLEGSPNLVIAKSDGRSEVQEGDTVTFTLAYSNAGNIGVTNVVITDALVENLTFAWSTPVGSYDPAAKTITWSIGTLPVDGPHYLTVVATVDEVPSDSYPAANQAWIGNDGGNGPDSDLSDNYASDADLIRRPYLVVSKTLSGPSYYGTVLTFTVFYSNVGTLPANNVTITDALPVSTTFAAGSCSPACAADAGVVSFALGSVPAGASGSVSYALNILEGAGGATRTSPSMGLGAEVAGSVVVTSSVAPVDRAWCDGAGCDVLRMLELGATSVGPVGWEQSPQLRSNTFSDASWIPVVAPVAEVHWDDAALLQGQWVGYTTTDQFAPNYSLYRQEFCLPLNAAGLSSDMASANDDLGTFYLNGSPFFSNRGAGAYDLVLGVQGVQPGINLLAVHLRGNTHKGHAYKGGGDMPGLLYRLSTSYARLLPFAFGTSMLLVGQTAYFGADEGVLGGSAPYSYTVDFGDLTLPSEYTRTLPVAHAYAAPGEYMATVTVHSLEGCTGEDTVRVVVLPAQSSLLANRAGVVYQNTMGRPYSGESGAGAALQAQADLAIDKGDEPDPVVAGETLTYTILVTNYGPSVATNVMVTDELPARVTFFSATPGYVSTNPVTWGLGDIPAGLGASRTCTVVVTVNEGTNGTISNTVSVSSDGDDPNLANNVDQEATNVHGLAALLLTKSASPEAYGVLGEVITYTYVVRNVGNVSLAGPFTVTDSVLGTVPCGAEPLAPDEMTPCATTHTVTQQDLDNGLITNGATATTTYRGEALASGPVSVTVTAVQLQHLTLSKGVASTIYAQAGAPVTYTLVVTNDGNVTLDHVNIDDPLLGGLACIPPQGETLAPREVLTCTGVYTIAQADLDAGQVDNVSTALGLGPEGQGAWCSASATATALQAPDIALRKDAEPRYYVTAGEVITYTYWITNVGNVTLSGPFTVTDNVLGTLAPCGSGPLAPSGTTACQATYLITQGDVDARSVTNVATATTPYAGNAVSSEAGSVTVTAALADLTVSKSAPSAALGGQSIAYTIVITNHGPEAARQVVVTDTLPAGVSFVSAVPLQSGGPQPLVWDLDDLTTGEVMTLTVVVNVDLGAAGPLTNTASVASRLVDPAPIDNSAGASTQVSAPTPTPTDTATLAPTATDTSTPTPTGTSTLAPTATPSVTPTETATTTPAPSGDEHRRADRHEHADAHRHQHTCAHRDAFSDAYQNGDDLSGALRDEHRHAGAFAHADRHADDRAFADSHEYIHGDKYPKQYTHRYDQQYTHADIHSEHDAWHHGHEYRGFYADAVAHPYRDEHANEHTPLAQRYRRHGVQRPQRQRVARSRGTRPLRRAGWPARSCHGDGHCQHRNRGGRHIPVREYPPRQLPPARGGSIRVRLHHAQCGAGEPRRWGDSSRGLWRPTLRLTGRRGFPGHGRQRVTGCFGVRHCRGQPPTGGDDQRSGREQHHFGRCRPIPFCRCSAGQLPGARDGPPGLYFHDAQRRAG